MGKKIRILFGVLLFCAGSACFLYPNLREWKTQREVDHIIEEFKDSYSVPDGEAEKSVNTTSESEEPSEDTGNPESGVTVFPELYAEMQEYNQNLTVSGQNIVDAWSYQQTPIDLSSMLSDTVGYIEIPDMKVRLPLYLGASSEHLAKGAAVMTGTSLPIGGESTNCVIAGHRGWRGSAYFQYIENMEIGSAVYITNPWETLTYRVTKIDIVKPSDVDCTRIQEGKDMVTLISCHPYVLGGGSYRYIVYCERAEEGNAVEAVESDTTEQPDTNTEDVSVLIEDGNLLEWETRLRTTLPALTLILAGVVVFIRNIRDRKHKN